jgi:hypothetical protein
MMVLPAISESPDLAVEPDAQIQPVADSSVKPIPDSPNEAESVYNSGTPDALPTQRQPQFLSLETKDKSEGMESTVTEFNNAEPALDRKGEAFLLVEDNSINLKVSSCKSDLFFPQYFSRHDSMEANHSCR